MPPMKSRPSLAAGALAGALFLVPFPGAAQEPAFRPEQIAKGASIFSRNCSPCHGTRMQNPESAFDLMPPWGDLLAQDDIEALWSYVVAGEKN
jgi:mono/diheme cytochrome c family protein